LRATGFRALGYIDDFAAAPPGAAPATAAAATAGRRVAVRLFIDFGLKIAPNKGSAVGTTALPLLGYVVNTRRQLLLLPPVRLDRLRHASRHVLHHAAHHSRWVSSSRLRRLCGLAVSTLLAVPLARYHLRSLYDALAGRGRRRDARLDPQGLRDVRWWSALDSATGVGRALWDPTPAGKLTTNASPYGWGATNQRLVPARGLFAPALACWNVMLNAAVSPPAVKKQNSRNQILTGFDPPTPGRDPKVTPNESGCLLPTRLPMRLPCGLVTAGAFDICTRAILSESFAISHFLFLRF